MPAILMLALAGALAAQRAPGPRPGMGRPAQPGGMISAIDRWNSMSPEQRERALAKLPPERQQRIREQLARFNSLPASEQQRLRERYQRFAALPPAKQDLVRLRLRQFNAIPPERRQVLAREMRQLRNMPQEDRSARIASEDFRSRYSPDERQMLQDLSENLGPLPRQ
jgi:hypothetical protein